MTIISGASHVVQVLGRHCRPVVHAVLDGHAHAALEVAYDVAVHEPRARVVDVVPHRHPDGPREGGRGDEAVAPRGVDEVEALGDLLGGLGDAAPVEEAVALPEQVHLYAMLVDRVRRHGEFDGLEDDVDPCVVLGRDGYVIVPLWLRVEEKRRRVVESHRVDGLVERPVEALPGHAYRHLDRLVSDWRDGRRWERLHRCLVEEDDVGRRVDPDIVDVADGRGARRRPLLGIAVRQRRITGNHLRHGKGCHAHGKVPGRVQLDHDGVPVAVGDFDSLDLLRLDVVAVHGVEVHRVLIDGEGARDEAESADEVEGHPCLVGAGRLRHLNNLIGGVGSGAVVKDSGGQGREIRRQARSLDSGEDGGRQAAVAALGARFKQIHITFQKPFG